MYSVNARDNFNGSPPFLMASTTKQMRPNGKGEGRHSKHATFHPSDIVLKTGAEALLCNTAELGQVHHYAAVRPIPCKNTL